MIPRILEYEDGRVKVTAHAYAIPEVKVLIDKYDMKVEPYLAYVHAMSAPDSPYNNVPEEERAEVVIYDVKETLGDFDHDDELLDNAIKKFDSLYTSTTKRYYDAMKISIERMAQYIKTAEIEAGKDGNLAEIHRMHKEAGATIRNFKDIEKQVDEELKVKMKGNNELGEY
jgi:hypothetical protein